MRDLNVADTLSSDEHRLFRERTAAGFPAHRCTVCANEEGQSWVVMEPDKIRPGVQRFTICRIEPSILVLVEDHDQRRQICSLTTIEDALSFVRTAADQAILAAMNAHPAHTVPQ